MHKSNNALCYYKKFFISLQTLEVIPFPEVFQRGQ